MKAEERDSLETRRGRPRGAALATALVSVLVVSLMSAALVQTLVLQRRQGHAQLRQLQAFWLAEAGIQRAKLALAEDPQYTGSRWQVQLNDRGQPAVGAAEIHVEAVPDQPQQRRVIVTAVWPDDPIDRHRQVREAVLDVSQLAALSD